MQTFFLEGAPHFVSKEEKDVERERKDLDSELEIYAACILDRAKEPKSQLIFASNGDGKPTSIRLCCRDRQGSLTADTLTNLRFFRIRLETACEQAPMAVSLGLARNVRLLTIGDLTAKDRPVLLPLRRLQTDGADAKLVRNFLGAYPIQLDLHAEDNAWRHTLTRLAALSGEVRVTATRVKISETVRFYLSRLAELYRITYGEVREEDTGPDLSTYRSIAMLGYGYQATIEIGGEHAESVAESVLQDLDSNGMASPFASQEELAYLKSLQSITEDGSGQDLLPTLRALPYIYSYEEASALLQLPYSFGDALPGVRHFLPKPFVIPEFDGGAAKTQACINLGHLEKGPEVSLPLEQLRRHLLITGVTGSGKTNTITHLIDQIADQGTPFLIVDPIKREYEEYFVRRGLEDRIFDFLTPERSVSFNPFLPPPTETALVSSHVSLLTAAINLLFPSDKPTVGEIIRYFIIEAYYTKLVESGREPNLDGLTGADLHAHPEWVPTFPEFLVSLELKIGTLDVSGAKGYFSDWVAYFGMKSKVIARSRVYKILAGGPQDSIYRQFDLPGGSLIELYTFADQNESNFIFSLVMMLLYQHRLAEGLQPNLRHLVVLEEAHRIMAKTTSGMGTEEAAGKIVGDMLAEIRAYGEAVIIAEQSVSKVRSDALINTATKIIHRVLFGPDKDAIAEAMSLTDREKGYLSYLQAGEAITFLSGAYQPVYMRVPLCRQISFSTVDLGDNDEGIQEILGSSLARCLAPGQLSDSKAKAAAELLNRALSDAEAFDSLGLTVDLPPLSDRGPTPFGEHLVRRARRRALQTRFSAAFAPDRRLP